MSPIHPAQNHGLLKIPSPPSSDPRSSVKAWPGAGMVLSVGMGVGALLDRIGGLKSLLDAPVRHVINRGELGKPSPELMKVTLNRCVAMIREECLNRKQSWSSLAKELFDAVAPDGLTRPVTDPRFRQDLENLVGSKFTPKNKVKILADGPASFDKRYRLIKKATDRIYLMSYQINEDETSMRMAELLAKAARRGVDVRVLVDKKTALSQSNSKALEKMRGAGVIINLWDRPKNPLVSLHGKIFVADDQAIVGGMNCGNSYSWRWQVASEDGSPRYRDTDLLVKGSKSVGQACEEFTKRWNEVASDTDQLPVESKFRKDDVERCSVTSAKPDSQYPPTKTRNADVMVISQCPDTDEHLKLAKATLKLILSAQHSIDIQNAYILNLPPVQQALKSAVARGVDVRVLTNSRETAAESIVATPSMRALKELAKAGVKVYLRTDSYLHSKIMVVDREYSVCGSFNLHPRSMRYDNEVMAVVHNRKFAGRLTALMNYDVRKAVAQRVGEEQITWKENLESLLAEKVFFDHL